MVTVLPNVTGNFLYIYRCWTLLALLFHTKKSVTKNVNTLAACPPGCGDPQLLTPARARVKAPVAEAGEPPGATWLPIPGDARPCLIQQDRVSRCHLCHLRAPWRERGHHARSLRQTWVTHVHPAFCPARGRQEAEPGGAPLSPWLLSQEGRGRKQRARLR